MLEKLFTSKARVKILELLLFRPSPELHLREIARLTGFSPPYVKKELTGLQRINLVTGDRRGNMKTYRMNRASPIYEDLKRIFLKTESLGDFLSKELSGLGGLTYALIYGSFARGEEKEKSDIDLLIIGDVPEEKVVGMISDVERQIGREVNYILWSTTEFENRCRGKHPFLAEIAARPVIGLIGDMDEFRKAAARQENRKNTRK